MKRRANRLSSALSSIRTPFVLGWDQQTELSMKSIDAAAAGTTHDAWRRAPAPELPRRAGSDIFQALTVPELIAEAYRSAAPAQRGILLEQLLEPLGALSLVAVAGGIFAKLRFQNGWRELHVRVEDIGAIRAVDVATLVDHVQQVSAETIDGLVTTGLTCSR